MEGNTIKIPIKILIIFLKIYSLGFAVILLHGDIGELL